MRLKAIDIILLVYGGIVLVGGALGFFLGNSVPSLISGLVAESLVTVGVVTAQKKPQVGYGLCLFVAVAMLGFFTYRFSSTGNAMPALPVIALSATMIALLVQAHFAQRKAGQ